MGEVKFVFLVVVIGVVVCNDGVGYGFLGIDVNIGLFVVNVMFIEY